MFNKNLKDIYNGAVSGRVSNWELSEESINTIGKEASYQFTGNRVKFENSKGELELYNVKYDDIIVKNNDLEMIKSENFLAMRPEDEYFRKILGRLDGTFKLKVERIK